MFVASWVIRQGIQNHYHSTFALSEKKSYKDEDIKQEGHDGPKALTWV